MADRIGWLGESRQRRIAEHLGGVIDAWWDDWAVEAGAWQRENREHGSAGHVRAIGFEHLAVQIDGPQIESMTAANTPVDTEDPFAQHLLQESRRDLFARLMGQADPVLVKDDLPLPSALTTAMRGAGRQSFSYGPLRLSILFDRTLADRWAPVASVQQAQLSPRNSAIGQATISLRAELALGALPLADIRRLRPGDVIATGAPLTAAPSIVDRDRGKGFFTVDLGSHAGHVAVRIASTKR